MEERNFQVTSRESTVMYLEDGVSLQLCDRTRFDSGRGPLFLRVWKEKSGRKQNTRVSPTQLQLYDCSTRTLNVRVYHE